MTNLESIKKILVVRNDNIGDLILTTPAIEALRKRFPDAYIAMLVAEYASEAIEGNPYLDKVYSYQKAKHSNNNRLIAWWRQYRVIKKIREEKFDLAIGIRCGFSPSAGWLVFASGAPLRIGDRPKKNEYFSFYFNVYSDEMTDKQHEVMRVFNFLKKLDISFGGEELFIYIPEEDKIKAREFIEENVLKKGKKLICLHITRREEEGRYWDIENYIALVNSLMERKDIDLVLNWPPKEKPLAEEILSKAKKQPLIFISKGIKSLAAFLRECNIFITLDGGAMHIATAVNTPTIAIFGKTDPEVWHPWGEGHTALKRGDNYNSVTVEDVLGAVDKILGKGK